MNVKPGDLAIVTNSVTGNYVGMVVEVVESAGVHKTVGQYWKIRVPRQVYTGNAVNPFKSRIPAGGLAQHRDAWLRPVSGLPDAESTDESVGSPARMKEVA